MIYSVINHIHFKNLKEQTRAWKFFLYFFASYSSKICFSLIAKTALANFNHVEELNVHYKIKNKQTKLWIAAALAKGFQIEPIGI